ncbi:MAG: hypothetical protein OEX12_05005 [Gammaproteobacteria bacterium]|nr:hypothetical protein [Gammaproteobacteria bacterium]
MFKLNNAISAWGCENFEFALKTDILNVDISLLPLQEGLTLGHCVSDSGFDIMVLNISDSEGAIFVRVGVFFQGAISGCNCADDPSPNNLTTEYCTLQLTINKYNADTHAELLDK